MVYIPSCVPPVHLSPFLFHACTSYTVSLLPLQHCDKVILQQYPGMTLEGQVYAQIVGDQISVTGSRVTFSKTPTLVRSYIIATC